MVDFVAWGTADPLTVEQAACLWANLDPSSSSSASLRQTDADRSAIAPLLQMLTGAIVAGMLRAETRTNAFHIIGDHRASLVKRADLMAFALARGMRPAFLFDTMLNPSAKAPNSEPVPNRNKGGASPTYDWNTFILEVIRIADSVGLPAKRAELAEIMRAWFIDQIDDHPSDTTLEDRIRPIYQYIERSRKPASK